MKKKVKAVLLISLMTMVILVGCKTKEESDTTYDITVSINKPNIELSKSETIISRDKKEVARLKKDGDKYLSEKHFEAAKSAYEEAIVRDRYNSELYLAIKESYVQAGRYDDAYGIVSKAIDNNVAVEAMEEVLGEITVKFDIVTLNQEVYQEDIYILPEEGEVVINGEPTTDLIVWDKQATTDTPGKYMYEGHTLVYNRGVNLILNVKDNVYDRKIGYIRNIYGSNENNSIVIGFDEAEFYRGDKALAEAIKDEQVEIDEEGKYIMLNEYYVRNSSYDIVNYNIGKFPSYNLLNHEINDFKEGSRELDDVDYETIKRHIDNYKDSDEEEKLLFWIDMKNGEVITIARQYTGRETHSYMNSNECSKSAQRVSSNN